VLGMPVEMLNFSFHEYLTGLPEGEMILVNKSNQVICTKGLIDVYTANAAAGDYFGPAYRDKQSAQAKMIADTLRKVGYEIACNSYSDLAYATADAASVRTDLENWSSEVSPIVADIDILVYAKDGDIAAAGESYSGEKFTDISAQGFRYYIGSHNSGASWQVLDGVYMRCGQLPVTADTIQNNGIWFDGMFDSSVLEAGR